MFIEYVFWYDLRLAYANMQNLTNLTPYHLKYWIDITTAKDYIWFPHLDYNPEVVVEVENE